MEQYLVGSKLLGLSEGNEQDYLVIDDNLVDGYKYEIDKENHIDYFKYSTSKLSDYFNFRVDYITEPKSVTKYIILYQLDADIIEQNFPIEFHVLEHKNDFVNLLRYILSTQSIGFSSYLTKNNEKYCVKQVYHIAYLTYIFKNNSTTLTNEQKSKIQLIHDKEMPISYLEELREEISSLQ